MREPLDIDHTHSQAISQEIGERLEGLLGKQPATTVDLAKKIERLDESERQLPPPTAGMGRSNGRPGIPQQGGSRLRDWLRLPW
jgi:hypothetical protein